MCVSNAMLKKNETRFQEKEMKWKSNENFNVKYVVVVVCEVGFSNFLGALGKQTGNLILEHSMMSFMGIIECFFLFICYRIAIL